MTVTESESGKTVKSNVSGLGSKWTVQSDESERSRNPNVNGPKGENRTVFELKLDDALVPSTSTKDRLFSVQKTARFSPLGPSTYGFQESPLFGTFVLAYDRPLSRDRPL